jgi:hypothetical protein
MILSAPILDMETLVSRLTLQDDTLSSEEKIAVEYTLYHLRKTQKPTLFEHIHGERKKKIIVQTTEGPVTFSPLQNGFINHNGMVYALIERNGATSRCKFIPERLGIGKNILFDIVDPVRGGWKKTSIMPLHITSEFIPEAPTEVGPPVIKTHPLAPSIPEYEYPENIVPRENSAPQ